MEQLDFSTQNQRILQILKSGGSINRIEAIEQHRILALNSRISDLRNKKKITGIIGEREEGSKCLRYRLIQDDSEQSKAA